MKAWPSAQKARTCWDTCAVCQIVLQVMYIRQLSIENETLTLFN